jgi:glyoxylase-like metal-dependent hydrolase (beta-lactamase superfamily II)
MHRVKLGDVELHVLDDGTWRFPAHMFFANVPESVWGPLVGADGEGKIPVGHNHGLLRAAEELIVVDTGYGDDTHGGCTGHLLEDLARAGYRPEQVTKVITTHGHGDHVKRHTVLRNGQRRPTFPNARYLVPRQDWLWFAGPGRVPEFDEQLAPLEQWGLLELFDGRQSVARGVTLLPTPGHTPGHTSVLVESQGECAIFLGDLCHHPLHFAHPSWVSGFDTDPHLTPATRARVFALAVERAALLVCPHAPAPGLGRLRRRRDGYEWEAVAR